MFTIVDLGEDLRYAIRQYAKEPGITLVLLVTMALGIGANTGVFSILNGLLRWPLPVVLAILAPISLFWAWPRERAA